MQDTEQKFSKKTSFIIAVAGQLALLVLLVLYKLATFSSGTEILLQLRPVDPRDMLRGDYVTVRYDISRIHAYGTEHIQNGDTVYVPLYKESGKFWSSYGGVTKQLPLSTNGQLYIKGVVTSGAFDPGTVSKPESMYQDSELTIDYGIDSYYIPEGSGRQSELNAGNAYARVAVDADGKAIIKQLYVNDKPWPR